MCDKMSWVKTGEGERLRERLRQMEGRREVDETVRGKKTCLGFLSMVGLLMRFPMTGEVTVMPSNSPNRKIVISDNGRLSNVQGIP